MMALRPAGRRKREDDRVLPLINVVFLLLIFFMLAGGFAARDPFDLDLPLSISETADDLLKGPKLDDHTLYSSHTIWASRETFEDWTRSEAFRKAHKDAGSHDDVYLGHPNFESFDVIQTVKP